ncbi:MAG TPA: zf-TFIIB domain-containing protein [Fimbriimonas sp.]|nr:zf-TFIIB domain-containing protein [Fimbriimonas sp.]
MQCPKCEIIALTMSDRAGVEIDYCPACRGVWLDRGELDKIIERSLTYNPQAAAPVAAPVDNRRPSKPYKRDDDDDDDDDDYRPDYKRKKNRGFLGDIFDF